MIVNFKQSTRCPKKTLLKKRFLGHPVYQTSIIQIFWSLVAKNNIMFHSKHLILKTGWHKKWLFQENFLNIFEKISKIVWIFGIWHSFYKICKINTNQNNIKDVLFESHWAVIFFSYFSLLHRLYFLESIHHFWLSLELSFSITAVKLADDSIPCDENTIFIGHLKFHLS